jgi:hypothetical protein
MKGTSTQPHKAQAAYLRQRGARVPRVSIIKVVIITL